MNRNGTRLLALLAGALLLSTVHGPRADDAAEDSTSPDPVAAPAAARAETAADPAPLPAPRLGPAHLDPALGRYVADYGGGRAVLTLSAELQERLTRALAQNGVPWGVTVLLEPATGRVLAMAEHSRPDLAVADLALKALAPAASVFKLVTTAALLEQGVSPEEEVCFHGGRHRLDPRLLQDDPRRDRACSTLETAFGHSTNVVFAKLAGRGLDAPGLRQAAARFLFNTPIAFPRPLEPSTALIDDGNAFQLANTAAGFGAVRLSPLHAALLAAIVANGGVFVPPVLVDEVEGVPLPAAAEPWRVIDGEVAAELAEMMRTTVTVGTARKAFRQATRVLRGVSVAGKTGSLSDRDPYRDYTWFVGFAPADAPEVAVATVIANDRRWRVRAPAVARDALEAYFASPLARLAPQPAVRLARVGR